MKPSHGQYLVSIDLGTTNTVLAYAAPGSRDIELFDIEQLTAPGEVGAATLLPSARYHPAGGELAAGDLQLPWREADVAGVPEVVIGRLARRLGAQVPGRMVASAKSWLSHPGVDRMAPILPWGAATGVPQVSPVTASASYLAHLRGAWNTRFPTHPLERQQIVLTIPASFDEGARALTLEAARLAGLLDVRLLEEPQAALYDWLYRHRDTLAADLQGTRLVLVADVGGGTTDFSLVRVDMEHGEPVLTRIGVGNHLILGGDNMDLALAHLAESRLPAQEASPDAAPARLTAGRLAQLTERCRTAKEQLLAEDAPAQVGVTLLGTGSKLIGGSRSVTLTKEDVERIVVDGFFPLNAEQEAARRGRGAIVEFGLPYASDAAVTRHLVSFLRQHAAAAHAALGTDGATLPVPDTLLLNGGVFRADALARRLEATLDGWRGAPVKALHNDNPDVAVARGGVAYTLARHGFAPAIEGGSPRSYWLLLDGDKAPGVARRGVCILPRGTQPGREVRLTDRTFALRVGRPVRFHLVSTVADAGERAGDVGELDPADFIALPPSAMVLQLAGSVARKEVPVQLAVALSEVGTLEVHCVEAGRADGQRWLLEFQLRGQEEEGAEVQEEAPPPRFADAVERIERIFGGRAQQVDTKEVRQLRGQLEQLLGSRERWATPLLRRLFDALMERARGRRRSPEHERVWLNLAGFCLRPGFGHPLDDWRIGELWALFETGVQYQKERQVRAEWWTLWRRVAGGLDKDAQLRLLDDFAFNLQASGDERSRRPVTLVEGSEEDMLRLGAALERIPSAYKAEIGNWMLGQIVALPAAGSKFDAKAAAAFTRYLWALGRVGARQPFHGSAHEVAPKATVEAWLQAILDLDWKKIEPAGFAAAHLARRTGDRSRDIDDTLRAEIVRRLTGAGAPPTWAAMVRDVVELDQASEQRMFGEALPPGLKLIG
ncbi:Hsp70 family protein [Pseudoduganella chitinolytica]|uniref:Hsp70 family protein n=1 Tax=Pseudoduganella chitinolytica TaxID=34070 RepID=A0ABY8BCD8_9BURK|nr:Hsp70 family protein [Pseudoduganella chitinolytica]WEF33570.1 Hsp70 family protein [Pseudoduganella chitinolytica]